MHFQNIDDFVVAFHQMLLAGNFLKSCRVGLQLIELLTAFLDLAVVILHFFLYLAQLAITASLLENIVLVNKDY